MEKEQKVLVIDNDLGLCKLIEAILIDNGYNVSVYANPYEGVAAFKNDNFSLVITDIKMPGIDGIEVLDQIKRFNHLVPVIIITAHATVDISIQALRKGADDMLTKPFESAELILRVKNAFRHNALLRENIQLKELLQKRGRFENIIGISNQIKELLDKIQRVAPRDIAVLIVGESGTGKELVAQAIHYNSTRKDKPFIALNCGALPQNLMESELFGHKKGSFTGASEDKVGLIELAAGGTLFLDEVGNLSLDAQKGLLRFLQEREFRRIGDSKTIKVDVRVVSATNTDLQKAIKDGTFREDLFYRLNGIMLNIPPLRERKEDIPLLATHFVKMLNKEFETNFAGFTADAMDALMSYHWPGNIRELKNVVSGVMALETQRFIGLETLKQFIPIIFTEKEEEKFTEGGEYSKILSHFETDYFLKLLNKHKWNVEDAAKEAGINIATLYRKIKRYNLKKE